MEREGSQRSQQSPGNHMEYGDMEMAGLDSIQYTAYLDLEMKDRRQEAGGTTRRARRHARRRRGT